MNHVARALAALSLVALALSGCASTTPAQTTSQTQAAIQLFNGKDLSGWTIRGGHAAYAVEHGEIVGRTVPGEPNSFLCTDLTFRDFELTLEFKVDKDLNSGVQIRSQAKASGKNEIVYGYQIEIDPSTRAWTAGLYEEAARGWLVDMSKNPAARAALHQGDWNRLRIRVVGDTFNTWLNDIPAVVDFKDAKTSEGFIGLQVHSVGSKGKGLEVRFRNIAINPLNP